MSPELITSILKLSENAENVPFPVRTLCVTHTPQIKKTDYNNYIHIKSKKKLKRRRKQNYQELL